MKNYSLFFLLALLLLSCKSNQNASDSTSGEEKAETNKKQATDMKFVNLQPPRTDYKVKEGQELRYSFTEHASVGNTGEFEIVDPSIIEFKEKALDYKLKIDESAGGIRPAGGDEAKASFIFVAKKKGETKLKIKELFRGEVMEEWVMKVVVE